MNKIIITSDCKTTTARMYDGKTLIKESSAKCSPEDVFDFSVGAKIAFERLIAEEKKPEVKEWKVVNRPARVGDYIRLKSNAGFTFNQPGDILKVDIVTDVGKIRVFGKSRIRETGDLEHPWTYLPHEYEVVEPIEELKIEVGKKYKIKKYEDVEEHVCILEQFWRNIRSSFVIVEEKNFIGHIRCLSNKDGLHWWFDPEAFECEWKEPEYFKGKAICIKNDGLEHVHTVGKIYDFSKNDGLGENDLGGKILNYPRKSLDDVNAALLGQRFIEYKGEQ